MEKKRQVAIVHYNTPELTEAAILSLRKHGGEDYEVTIFDNSNERPFCKQMKGVRVIDNTRGQVLDIEAKIKKFPNRYRYGVYNGWGSDKHMISIQKLWEILPDGFLLMDSDILLKKNVDFMFNENYCAVGHVQSAEKARNRAGIDRMVPMLCYINVPMCRKCGIEYFDPKRSWMMHSGDVTDRRNWYDTGASFLEDIKSHKNGARGLRIDIRPLMEHYQRGSWQKNDVNDHLKWLEQHRDLWRLTPEMQGIKDVAICAIGRQENRYAREFVEHYHKLGAKKIFVYDNYYTGEERLQDVLQDYVKKGWVEIIDLCDRPDMQCRSYDHCYRMHGYEYAWIGFFDFDELLRIKSGETLPKALAHYKEGDQLLINWRIMTDNGLTFYDERPMAERFTEPMMPLDKLVKYADKPENSHVKCFVRGGLDDVRFTPTHNPHCADTPRMKCINPSGEEVHQGAFAPIDHKVMWIDHYFTKTAEEWMHVKLSRGYHGLPKHTAGIVAHQEERFFAVNERTPEKEAILRGEKVERPEPIAPPTFDEAQGTPAPEPKPAKESKPKTRKQRSNKKK